MTWHAAGSLLLAMFAKLIRKRTKNSEGNGSRFFADVQRCGLIRAFNFFKFNGEKQ